LSASHGEKISTAFAESAVNQVVSKRMVKKQQMRWSESGAHNLLQVRTKVLNDQLWETFVRWYPGMQTEQETQIEEGRVGPGLKCSPIYSSHVARRLISIYCGLDFTLEVCSGARSLASNTNF
jgi:hypothetical protein